jgi:uncharacterized protein YbjQ (UPF0145 family)
MIFDIKDVIITTTGDVSGHEIKDYHGLVIETVAGAAGTGYDIIAKFSDWFGGKIKGYEKSYGKLLAGGMEAMAREALNRGANAIIGFSMSMVPIISGDSILVIMLSGTAVRTERNAVENSLSERATPHVDSSGKPKPDVKTFVNDLLTDRTSRILSRPPSDISNGAIQTDTSPKNDTSNQGIKQEGSASARVLPSQSY